MKTSSPAFALAFDCACSGLSLAVLEGDTPIAEHSETTATGQAALLAPAIRSILDRAGVTPSELTLIATTTGPGSFTGIRIGLAMARGLALALSIPLASCSTFDAVLASLPAAERRRLADAGVRIILAIDSRRAEIFVATAGPHGAEDPGIVRPDDAVAALPAGAYALIGDGAPLMRQAFAAAGREAEIAHRDERPPIAANFAPALAAAGAAHWQAVNRRDGMPRPLYLRPADVTLPKAAAQ